MKIKTKNWTIAIFNHTARSGEWVLNSKIKKIGPRITTLKQRALILGFVFFSHYFGIIFLRKRMVQSCVKP